MKASPAQRAANQAYHVADQIKKKFETSDPRGFYKQQEELFRQKYNVYPDIVLGRGSVGKVVKGEMKIPKKSKRKQQQQQQQQQNKKKKKDNNNNNNNNDFQQQQSNHYVVGIELGIFGEENEEEDEEEDENNEFDLQPVAIKIFQRGDLSPEAEEKIFQQVFALRALTNLCPNEVIHIYDVFELQKQFILVMQLSDSNLDRELKLLTLEELKNNQLSGVSGVAGGVKSVLKFEGQVHPPVPASMARTIIHSMLTAIYGMSRITIFGLQSGNHAGVAHGQLRPRNVLVRGGNFLLTDFLVATLYREKEEASRIVLDAALEDDHLFVAPEILRNKALKKDMRKSIDRSSADLFSLGCTLHQLLSGCRPFKTYDDVIAWSSSSTSSSSSSPSTSPTTTASTSPGQQKKAFSSTTKHNILLQRHPLITDDDAWRCICHLVARDPAHRYTINDLLTDSWIRKDPEAVAALYKRIDEINSVTTIPDSSSSSSSPSSGVGGGGDNNNNNNSVIKISASAAAAAAAGGGGDEEQEGHHHFGGGASVNSPSTAEKREVRRQRLLQQLQQEEQNEARGGGGSGENNNNSNTNAMMVTVNSSSNAVISSDANEAAFAAAGGGGGGEGQNNYLSSSNNNNSYQNHPEVSEILPAIAPTASSSSSPPESHAHHHHQNHRDVPIREVADLIPSVSNSSRGSRPSSLPRSGSLPNNSNNNNYYQNNNFHESGDEFHHQQEQHQQHHQSSARRRQLEQVLSVKERQIQALENRIIQIEEERQAAREREEAEREAREDAMMVKEIQERDNRIAQLEARLSALEIH